MILTGTLDELAADTIGSAREVRIVLQEPLDGLTIEHVTSNGDTLTTTMQDIGQELGPLVDQLRGAGASITDLRVASPSLQDVFIHLTGRELRD